MISVYASQTPGKKPSAVLSAPAGRIVSYKGVPSSRSMKRARDFHFTRVKSPTLPNAGGEGVCRMAKSSNRVTSKAVAQKASKALSDGRSSANTKSIAASALSQRKR